MSWEAEYYGRTNFTNLLLETNEAEINIGSEDDLPQEVKDDGTEYISARWTQTINGPGEFRFTCTTDDGMRIKVDGSYVINEWRGQSCTRYTATRTLSSGPHIVIVEWYQGTGGLCATVTIDKLSSAQSEQDIRRAWNTVKSSGGRTTRGGLVPARLFESDDDGNPIYQSPYGVFYCQFNPSTYSISKNSSFTFSGIGDDKNYNVSYEYDSVEPASLSIKELWFDTSEDFNSDGSPVDVRTYTDALSDFADSTAAKYSTNFATYSGATAPPPKVGFLWGPTLFVGVIESLSIKYTLFHPSGTPLRAKCTLQLKEFRLRKSYPSQNPTSGTLEGVRLWHVKQGERLDSIAANVYGKASHWRTIAELNDIVDPLDLEPGQYLQLPAIS